MLAAAGDEVRAYVAALAKNQISARPSLPRRRPGATRRWQSRRSQCLRIFNFMGFDVWLTDQPVMILSAEAHIPAAPGAPAAATEPYSVTLVARTDIYGNLRKLYSGVTDKFHLDVTPRLELIDAVDADGDGRAELLFHETTDAGGGYVIYRATPDKLWKMFDQFEFGVGHSRFSVIGLMDLARTENHFLLGFDAYVADPAYEIIGCGFALVHGHDVDGIGLVVGAQNQLVSGGFHVFNSAGSVFKDGRTC